MRCFLFLCKERICNGKAENKWTIRRWQCFMLVIFFFIPDWLWNIKFFLRMILMKQKADFPHLQVQSLRCLIERYPLWTVPYVFCSKYNGEVHAVMKKILSPLNRSCMKSGCNILWLPMFIPQRNFFLFMLQSIRQRPLPFLLLPLFCLPAKEKMRSTVRIFLLHQFSSTLIIPQNICVIAENHLLFPAYPLKC